MQMYKYNIFSHFKEADIENLFFLLYNILMIGVINYEKIN